MWKGVMASAGSAVHLVLKGPHPRRGAGGDPVRAGGRRGARAAVDAAAPAAHERHLHGLAQCLRRRGAGGLSSQGPGPASQPGKVHCPNALISCSISGTSALHSQTSAATGHHARTSVKHMQAGRRWPRLCPHVWERAASGAAPHCLS